MGSSRDVSESRWCWRLPEGAASVLVGISDAVRWYVKVEKSVAIVAEMESIYRRGPEFCYLAREGPSEPRSRGEDDVCHSLPKAPVRHFVTVWSHFAFHSLTFT